jgi:hypothetical protein
MINELILWTALAVLIALMALAVWAGRRGLHALGVVGPGQGAARNPSQDKQMDELIVELRRLNTNLEQLVETKERQDS